MSVRERKSDRGGHPWLCVRMCIVVSIVLDLLLLSLTAGCLLLAVLFSHSEYSYVAHQQSARGDSARHVGVQGEKNIKSQVKQKILFCGGYWSTLSKFEKLPEGRVG